MPHLISARFESIGHRDARLDGLLIDFTDHGNPCDSVMWLRNGGGKSSILNLLFSILRPSQHDFLGTGAEGKLRELRDYLGADEVGQICLEWRLDAPAGEPAPRLFTGACIDQRPSDGQPFKRLWYAIRVAGSSALSMSALPIVETATNGRKRVLRPSALRDRLTVLDDGETTVTLTDVQREWEKHLVSFGIDPTVFKYQLEMNKREGAADDLFRFGSSEEFAEFILDMVLDPSTADEVGRRLADLRHKLSRRPDLEAEYTALERTGPRLRDLVQIGDARQNARRKTQEALRATAELASALTAGASSKAAAEIVAKNSAVSEQARHNAAAGRRHNGTWALEVYAWRKATLDEGVAKKEKLGAEQGLEHADREKKTLDLVPAMEQLEIRAIERRELSRAREATLEKNRPLLDELAIAASSFVGAIELEQEVVRVRLDFGGRRLDEATRALKASQEEKTKETEALGGFKAKHETKSGELAELERQRGELVSGGALGEDEAPRKGLQRHVRAAAAEAMRAKESADIALAREQQALDAERLRSDAMSLVAKVAEQRRAAQQDLAAAELDLKRLSEEQILQRTLEDSNPDLRRLMPQAVSRLASTRARLHEQLVLLGIETQLDRRALDSLTGVRALLPPSLDADRVQGVLRAAGLNAFAGVAYLADAVAPERVAMQIQFHPELAAGVVVDQTEMKAANEVLARESPSVEGPVAVGTTADLIGGGSEKVVVLPPRASFDRAAAVQERERRLERSAERDARSADMRNEQAAIDEIRARLQGWAERYPSEWWGSHHRNIEQWLRDEAETSSRGLIFERTVVEARAAATTARDESRAALDRERAASQLAARVEAFVSRGGAEIETLAKTVSLLGTEIAAARMRIAGLDEESTRLTAEIESKREDLRVAKDQVRVLRDERVSAAEHVRGRVGPTLPISAARERFRVLRDQMAREVGADALQGQIEQLSRQIERDRKKFDADLADAGITEDAVRESRSLATSTTGVDEARRRANVVVQSAQQRLIDIMTQLKVSEKERKEAAEKVEQRRHQRRGAVEEFVAACSNWTIERFIGETLSVRADIDAATVEEAEAKASWDQAQNLASALETERKGFQSLVPRLTDAMAGAPEGFLAPDMRVVNAIDRLEGAAANVDRNVEELQLSLKTLRASEQKAERAVSELNSFIREDAQAKLPPQLKDRLADPTADILLTRAHDFALDVERRALTIRDELATIDQHRKVVAQQLQSVTDPALRVLTRLERASMFPPHVAVWGGSPFIRVKLKVADTVSERNAIASTLIDQIVTLGEIPSGLKLVKRLVRDLAGPGGLRIEILKPEPLRRLLYEPVEHLGKFSRGEQLTAAILLYCTLAQQRATSRGGGRAPTSVLILDNPLGTCSNPQLVELQRAMARVHGVQLVYTTGIEDLEALAQLPNVIRLRNASVDMRGRRHVSHDEDRPALEVARVAVEEVV